MKGIKNVKFYGWIIIFVGLVIILTVTVSVHRSRRETPAVAGSVQYTQTITITKEIHPKIEIPLGFRISYSIVDEDVAYIVHYNIGQKDEGSHHVRAKNDRPAGWAGKSLGEIGDNVSFSIDPGSKKQSAKLKYTFIPK